MPYIPLSYFNDLLNPHEPKGLLIQNGLTSAMRNPLYKDFKDHIVVDFRPRDFSVAQRGGYFQDIKFRSLTTATANNASYVINTELDGVSLTTTVAQPYLVDIYKEKGSLTGDSSGQTPYYCRNKNLIMVAAVKVNDLLSGQVADTSLGILCRNSAGSNDTYCQLAIDQWNGSAPRLEIYQIGATGGATQPLTSAANDALTSESLNKWLMIQVTLSENSQQVGKYRVLGGQFYNTTLGLNYPRESLDILGVHLAYYPNGIRIPINRYVSCAFATVAIYSGDILPAKTGLGINDIRWQLFDREHVCGSYSIRGNNIRFANVGRVAWEIYVGSNEYTENPSEYIQNGWVNTDGSIGTDNRVFYDTGTWDINTPDFIALRPVLENTGVLNADNNAVLTWVSTTTTETSEYIFYNSILPTTTTEETTDPQSLVYLPEEPYIFYNRLPLAASEETADPQSLVYLPEEPYIFYNRLPSAETEEPYGATTTTTNPDTTPTDESGTVSLEDPEEIVVQPVVAHKIKSENVFFCYRMNDADSIEVAEYYRILRQIPSENFIALPCENKQTLNSYEEYLEQIEVPIMDALLNPYIDRFDQCMVIILGYHVPISYYTSENTDDPYSQTHLIAVASRLHRVGHSINYKYSNFTYDRRGAWKYFDSSDSPDIKITAVLNGPTKNSVKKLIDRGIDVQNQTFITGKIYIDPYGKKDTDEQLLFQSELIDFIDNEVNNLGLEYDVTVNDSTNLTDPTVTALNNDSFFFGWFNDRYSKNLFLNQSERRVFLYNADNDSASHMLDSFDSSGSDPWSVLAINVEPGYASCAGAVEDPTPEAYVRPRPFFEALHRGASLGESFLYANPYVDWKMILIGDPLITVSFPSDLPTEQIIGNELINNNEVIFQIKEIIEESLAHGQRQSILTQNILDKVIESHNLDETESFLHNFNSWKIAKDSTAQNNLFVRSVDSFLNYILKTTGLKFEQWLQRENKKTTTYLNELIKNNIAQGFVSDDLLYIEGSWDFVFVYNHPRHTREKVHFRIQVGYNNNFDSIVFDLNSDTDITGWNYESEPNKFVQLDASGLYSNLSGRRIMFNAPQEKYLTRGEEYTIRWQPIDHTNTEIHGWVISNKKLIIKR